jgi:predicted DNA-binding transcriptional regulator AlpA
MSSTKPIKKSPPRRRAPLPPYVVGRPDDDGTAPRPNFIFKPEVLKLTGYTFPTLWKWMRDGQFPMSFDIGTKTAWLESEINDWLASRPRSKFKKSGG